jgi:hypothetical protein
MHVDDVKSGLFSGAAVIEFLDDDAASRVVTQGILGCRARSVSEQEYMSLTSGEWPMLEYGPPQGVFSQSASVKPAAAVPMWAQPNRPPASNPWQK